VVIPGVEIKWELRSSDREAGYHLGGTANEAWVGLAEAVRAIRDELILAQVQAPHQGVRFELGPIEMEFAVTLSRGADGKAGVQIGVVTLGVGGSVSSESVHRVKFVLNPKDAETGDPLEIASQLDSIPDR
jgi:Trypsin-co-occurring domain 2